VAGFPDKHYYDGSLAARAISYACLNYNGGGGPETHVSLIFLSHHTCVHHNNEMDA
jgi:hypothetical protein